jgi:ubiquinone biosynthesis protein COQ4
MTRLPDDEATAVGVALGGSALDRARLGLRALGRVLRDPEDTRQIFVMYAALNAGTIPETLTRFLTAPDGPRLFRERAAIDSASVDFDALRRLPADTLGGAYARHMDENGLDPDIFQAPPGVPEAVAYLAQRLRQSHDIWHVVAGYGTDVAGELCLQAFTYAQTGAPGPLLLSAVGALRFSVREPMLVRRVLEGWRRGRHAASLLAVPWEDLWERPLSALRAELGVG